MENEERNLFISDLIFEKYHLRDFTRAINFAVKISLIRLTGLYMIKREFKYMNNKNI